MLTRQTSRYQSHANKSKLWLLWFQDIKTPGLTCLLPQEPHSGFQDQPQSQLSR